MFYLKSVRTGIALEQHNSQQDEDEHDMMETMHAIKYAVENEDDDDDDERKYTPRKVYKHQWIVDSMITCMSLCFEGEDKVEHPTKAISLAPMDQPIEFTLTPPKKKSYAFGGGPGAMMNKEGDNKPAVALPESVAAPKLAPVFTVTTDTNFNPIYIAGQQESEQTLADEIRKRLVRSILRSNGQHPEVDSTARCNHMWSSMTIPSETLVNGAYVRNHLATFSRATTPPKKGGESFEYWRDNMPGVLQSWFPAIETREDLETGVIKVTLRRVPYHVAQRLLLYFTGGNPGANESFSSFVCGSKTAKTAKSKPTLASMSTREARLKLFPPNGNSLSMTIRNGKKYELKVDSLPGKLMLLAARMALARTCSFQSGSMLEDEKYLLYCSQMWSRRISDGDRHERLFTSLMSDLHWRVYQDNTTPVDDHAPDPRLHSSQITLSDSARVHLHLQVPALAQHACFVLMLLETLCLDFNTPYRNLEFLAADGGYCSLAAFDFHDVPKVIDPQTKLMVIREYLIDRPYYTEGDGTEEEEDVLQQPSWFQLWIANGREIPICSPSGQRCHSLRRADASYGGNTIVSNQHYQLMNKHRYMKLKTKIATRRAEATKFKQTAISVRRIVDPVTGQAREDPADPVVVCETKAQSIWKLFIDIEATNEYCKLATKENYEAVGKTEDPNFCKTPWELYGTRLLECIQAQMTLMQTRRDQELKIEQTQSGKNSLTRFLKPMGVPPMPHVEEDVTPATAAQRNKKPKQVNLKAYFSVTPRMQPLPNDDEHANDCQLLDSPPTKRRKFG